MLMIIAAFEIARITRARGFIADGLPPIGDGDAKNTLSRREDQPRVRPAVASALEVGHFTFPAFLNPVVIALDVLGKIRAEHGVQIHGSRKRESV